MNKKTQTVQVNQKQEQKQYTAEEQQNILITELSNLNATVTLLSAKMSLPRTEILLLLIQHELNFQSNQLIMIHEHVDSLIPLNTNPVISTSATKKQNKKETQK